MLKTDFQFSWRPGGLVSPEFLEECAVLYSGHYGVWSAAVPFRTNARIRLSAKRIRQWLTPDSKIAAARCQGRLIGYAIAVQHKYKKNGIVSWVTQLVVHDTFRRQDVGKRLLFAVWGFSNHTAWGLVTANPFAVRALEKATRRRCCPAKILKSREKLIEIGRQAVPYIDDDATFLITQDESRVDTSFFVDHSDVPRMIEQATSQAKPWTLGPLEEGWEWFAFTFFEQEQIQLTPEEIEDMVRASEQITYEAYSRMEVNEDHRWSRFAAQEVRTLLDTCRLGDGATVFDIGCGRGRHAIEMGKQGHPTFGVDYVERSIEAARRRSEELDLSNVEFQLGDARTTDLQRTFDCVLCLYDVVGTYADDDENRRVLETAFRHVKPGGHAFFSVMNWLRTEKDAKYSFRLQEQPDRLLTLPAGNIMETTGDIFNPDFYIIDKESRVVYRKEQFQGGWELPEELIVRDRRFLASEIADMCRGVGFDVVWTRHVRAGKWGADDVVAPERAKEILVYCRRP